MKKKFRTFADSSLAGREEVYVSGGQIGLQLKMKPADLLRTAEITLADIARQGE